MTDNESTESQIVREICALVLDELETRQHVAFEPNEAFAIEAAVQKAAMRAFLRGQAHGIDQVALAWAGCSPEMRAGLIESGVLVERVSAHVPPEHDAWLAWRRREGLDPDPETE